MVDLAIVPPVQGFDHPTGEDNRDFFVALADGRCFKLGHALLEIRATIAVQVSCTCGDCLQGEPDKRQNNRSQDSDLSGALCQSFKYLHFCPPPTPLSL